MRSLMIRALLMSLVFPFYSSVLSAQNSFPITPPPQSSQAPWHPSLGTQNGSSSNSFTPNAGAQQTPESTVPSTENPSPNASVPPANMAPFNTPPSSTSLPNGPTPNSKVPNSGVPAAPANLAPNSSALPGAPLQTQTSNAPTPSPESEGELPTQDGGAAKSNPSQTPGKLPNEAGQVWREYDISPYTAKITSIKHPEQAILDWILRDTGKEMWFHQPLGFLNADRDHIYVYHTPQIQEVVKKIVDRFVRSQGRLQSTNISLITIDSPNWRSNVYSMLQPVGVRTPGVEAWMVSKENAARLIAQLSQRGDFKLHSGGQLVAHDGQELVLGKTTPKQFVRSLRWVPGQVPNYQPLLTTIDEGYELKISSLSSLDGSLIEVAIECKVDQVEKLTTVKVDVPSPVQGRVDKMDLQIPQMISWRLQERFRWPNDQVLLLSCGVVAKPNPQTARPNGLPDFLSTERTRADALVFIEYRGPASSGQYPNQLTPQTPVGVTARVPPAPNTGSNAGSNTRGNVPSQPRR